MKTLTIIVAVLVASVTFGAPHGHIGPRPGHGPIPMRRPPPPPRPMQHCHSHHHSNHSLTWFWTGLGTGLLIDALRPTPPPPPIVVGPVVHQRVWVPPIYETRPVFDVYGRVIRYDQVLVRPGYWQ